MDETARKDTLLDSARTLGDASREIAGWVPILRRLAEAEALRDLALGQRTEITGATVRSVIAARRLRDEYFWPSISEAAWAVLLELFANRLEGQCLDSAGVAAATGLPSDTALHWVEWLSGRGMVFRHAVTGGEETALIDLTDASADQMRAYLIAALKLSPWVQ